MEDLWEAISRKTSVYSLYHRCVEESGRDFLCSLASSYLTEFSRGYSPLQTSQTQGIVLVCLREALIKQINSDIWFWFWNTEVV